MTAVLPLQLATAPAASASGRNRNLLVNGRRLPQFVRTHQ
jgi:hypothetical protein